MANETTFLLKVAKQIAYAIIIFLTLSSVAAAQTKTAVKKKVLMVVSNNVTNPYGSPAGFWASEMIHPYYYFMEAGYEMTIVSPDGGKVVPEIYSDPSAPQSIMKNDLISLGFLKSPDFASKLDNTKKISDIRMRDYDAIVVAGGSAPVFTFPKATGLHKLFVEFYEARKPSVTLCHGTAVLLFAKLSNGESIAKGKTFTGYTNEEEDAIDAMTGRKRYNPYRIEEEAKKLGANFVKKDAFAPFAVRDGNLISGQQQNSGLEVAKLVIEALNEATASVK